MEGGDLLQLSLPPITAEDPYLSRKMKILSDRNLSSQLRLSPSSSREDILRALERFLQSARIVFLDEIELYFLEDDDSGPFSPRNELESLNLVLSVIQLWSSGADSGAVGVLRVLKEATVGMLGKVGARCYDYAISEETKSNDEDLLLRWAEEKGLKTKLRISHFKSAGRGAVASCNIDIGATVLEIPESLIIHEDIVYASEMNLEGITAETMLLLWSMKERHNSNSRFKNYFDTLPKKFETGLSFGIDALGAIEGTVLFEEIVQAKEHLRSQYDVLCPALRTNHPHIFKAELYTWDQFLWACELWYSNSMKIIFSDGKLKTCLVPVAGLLNHSLYPHISRFGRLDPVTKSLKLNLSRPCREGEQCFLSYGSLPGSHLVTFYGFLPPEIHGNPYDVIPLDFEDSLANDDEDNGNTSTKKCCAIHMVRGTWMAKNKGPPTYGLPPPLLDHLRSVLGNDHCDGTPQICALSAVDTEIEKTVLETLLSIFLPMMEELDAPCDLDRDGAPWDVKLALNFKSLHRKIVSSVVEACSRGLQLLGSL